MLDWNFSFVAFARDGMLYYDCTCMDLSQGRKTLDIVR